MAAIEHSRRRRIFAISAALHAALFGVIALLPESQRFITDATSYAPIELVPWAEPASVEPASPSSAPEPQTLAPAPRAPETAPRPSITKTPRARSSPSATTTSDAPPSDAPAAAPVDAPPSPRALALTGLRERSDGGVALPRPRGGGQHGNADLGGSPTAALREAGFARGRDGKWSMRSAEGGFIATMTPDGRVHFDDAPINPLKPPDGYSIIARAQGKELHARAKAQLLAKTFDARLAIAVRFAERNVERQLDALYGDLLDVWSDSSRSAAERRRLLFERWDECEETIEVDLPGFEDADGSPIDALRRRAGDQARRRILDFIRRQVPADGADAYTADEIARLDRGRSSREHFVPYE